MVIPNKIYRPLRIGLLFLGVFQLAMACSIQKIAVKSTSGILVKGLEAMQEESDLVLAEQATASNLKLLEALIKSDPGNRQLLTMAAEGYTSYALGFVEDQSPERASVFYLRAKAYGLQVLQQNKSFDQAKDGDLSAFTAALASFSAKDVAGLFWTANAWGSYINLNKTNVAALADISKVQALMERTLALDETYYSGGPHLFLGALLASRSRMLGGDPERAKAHFSKCLEINGGRFLLAKFLYAQSYAVQQQDRELFRTLLNDIQSAPDDLFPGQRLANEIAKRKAKMLLAMEDDLFF